MGNKQGYGWAILAGHARMKGGPINVEQRTVTTSIVTYVRCPFHPMAS